MARKRAQLTDESALATLDAGGVLDKIGADLPAVAVQELPVAQIQPNPFQPRQQFAPESIEELAASLRAHGFFGHLVVRKKGRGYQLAYGERRLRAAKLAGLDALPVQVRSLSDKQMLEIALTENVLREELHPVEEARAYLRLQEEMGYSVREIAERIGKSKSYVGTLLSIVRYPDLEAAVRSADIPVRTAEELAKIENEEERRYFIELVVAGKLERDQLIAARKQGYKRKLVRTADSKYVLLSAVSRAYRTLERQRVEHVTPEEKAETVQLLQQIISQAHTLLAELEKEQA